MIEQSNEVIAFCKVCDKDVTASVKMWDTIVCDECNTIISSNIGIDKVGK